MANSKLSWVRGNDVILNVTLTRMTETGDTEDFILDECDEWAAKVYDGLGRDTGCPLWQAGQNVISLDLQDTLAIGSYSVEVTAKVNGRDVRAYETDVFRVVGSNGLANVTLDAQGGEASADLDLTFQVLPQVITEGKNSYQLWLEQGNTGTLQDFIDGLIETHEITPTVIRYEAHADIIGQDNYVYHWENGRYVKTDIYVKGDNGDNLTWDDLTEEQKREIAGVSQEYRQDIKDGVASQLNNGTLSGTVHIAEGTTIIRHYMFSGCGVTEVVLPDTVETLQTYAFYNCAQLTALELPDSITTIMTNCFAYCTALTELILPKNLTVLDNIAINYMANLKYIAAPPYLTTPLVANQNYLGSNRRMLVYTGAQIHTFYGGTGWQIGAVLLHDEVVTPPVGSTAITFNGGNARAIYVPDGLVESYRASSYWTSQANYFQPLSLLTDPEALDFIRRVRERYGMEVDS